MLLLTCFTLNSYIAKQYSKATRPLMGVIKNPESPVIGRLNPLLVVVP